MRRVFLVLVTLNFCVATASAQSWSGLGAGIEIAKSPGVWRVRVDLCEPGVTIRATPPGSRGRTTVSRRLQAGDDVTINGDFYVGAKVPVGLAVGEGQYWSDTKDPSTHGGVLFGPGRVEFDEGPLQRAFNPRWMTDVVGGFPALVVDGGARNYTESQCFGSNKHTAVGLSADKRTMYLVVAQSITCGALANLMRDLGSEFALNLDGGGSSDMATAAGALIGSTRAVANHLGVKGFGNGVPHACIDRRLPAAAGHVRRHVTDPDSFSAWKFSDGHFVVSSDAQINKFGDGAAWPAAPKLVHDDRNGKLLIRDRDGLLRHIESPRSLRYWKLDGVSYGVASGSEGQPLPTMPILARHSDGRVFVIDTKPAEVVVPTPPDAGPDAQVETPLDGAVLVDAGLDAATPPMKSAGGCNTQARSLSPLYWLCAYLLLFTRRRLSRVRHGHYRAACRYASVVLCSVFLGCSGEASPGDTLREAGTPDAASHEAGAFDGNSLVDGSSVPSDGSADTQLPLSDGGISDAGFSPIGLTVTPDILATWRMRTTDGPFRQNDDYQPGSENEWEDVVSAKDAFVSDPSASRWLGPSGSDCVPSGGAHDPSWGRWSIINRAAFWSLIKDDASVRAAVVDELVYRTQNISRLDFSDTSQWCSPGIGQNNPGFEVANFVAGHLLALDYVLAADPNALSKVQREAVFAWLYHWADYSISEMLRLVRGRFASVDPLGDPADWGPNSGLAAENEPFDGEGLAIADLHSEFNNKRMQHWRTIGLIGAFLRLHGYAEPATSRQGYSPHELVSAAKNAVKAYLIYGTFPNGYVMDFRRAQSGGTGPDKGLYYAFASLAPVISLVDVLAIQQDTELLRYSTRKGQGASACQPGDDAKSVEWITIELLKHIDTVTYTRTVYGGTIDLVNGSYRGGRNQADMSMMPLARWMTGSNRQFLVDVIERQYEGQSGSWVNETAGFGSREPWWFDWGVWPTGHFMFNGVTP